MMSFGAWVVMVDMMAMAIVVPKWALSGTGLWE
jgi:hypothetical protein